VSERRYLYDVDFFGDEITECATYAVELLDSYESRKIDE